MHFRAKALLREAVIEPDHAVTMAQAPSANQKALMTKIRDLPWTGAGPAALEFYKQARELNVDDSGTLLKLCLTLYDGRHYEEALEIAKSLEKNPEWRFAAFVWEGQLLDLLGKRTEAVGAYHEALKMPGAPSIRHDQYGLVIDKKWAEERLKTPFERK